MKIIKNGLLVTMDDKRRVIKNGAIAISGNVIQEIGKTGPLCKKWPDAEIIDATNHIVLPGLINAHTHLFQVLYRGIGNDLPNKKRVEEVFWPMCKLIGRKESYLAALLASAEMLSSGVTTFLDSHFITIDKECYDGIAQAIEEIGIRGVIGRSTVDCSPAPPEFQETVHIAVKEARRVIKNYHQKANGRITVRVEPLHTLVSKEMILAMKGISREFDVGFSMHVAETQERVESCRRKFGYSCVERLQNLGILGANVLLAHCVWVNDEEIDMLADTDTKVVHNPVANQYLADGVAPITKMLNRGITVAIATDGAGTNNDQDIFEAMKSAALLQKVSQLDVQALNAQKVLEMVTIDAARSINMEENIGSLEEGKLADLVLVDLNIPCLVPSKSALSNLVYSAPSRAVDLVIIDGRTVFKKGEVSTLDQDKLVEMCNKKAEKMVKQAGVDHYVTPDKWDVQ